MLTKILDPEQDELLKEERRVLSRLRTALVRFEAAPEHQSALDQSIEQLDELFLLVIIGEFNAGKSAFINALVGSKVARSGGDGGFRADAPVHVPYEIRMVREMDARGSRSQRLRWAA